MLAAEGDGVTADLEELWRRIAFSILISNIDDHLRNHGFLRLTSAGWRLSPAFDMNPDPSPGEKRFSTEIAVGAPTTIATLLDVAPHFDLTSDRARAILGQILNATSGWNSVAQDCELDQRASRDMASAFEHKEALVARQIIRG